MYYTQLYWEFIKIRVQAQMTDRAAFFFLALGKIVGFGAEALVIWIMVDRFKTIGSWSANEIMFLYALNLITYSLAAFFLYHPFTKLPLRIQTGEFDEILTKPLNGLFYLISREVSTGYFGNLTIAVLIGALSLSKLAIGLNPVKVFFLITSILGGTLIQGAILIFAYTPSFWLVQNNSFSRILMDFRSFTRFPLSIYHGGIQVFLTVVLPYAFINYYPAHYFLGKNELSLFHPIFQYLSLPMGLFLFGAAYLFWSFALKHYKSTGS